MIRQNSHGHPGQRIWANMLILGQANNNRMKILIAPDSFKDALSAIEVANSIGKGILRSMPGTDIRTFPMADGGEGTVDALIHATGGRRVGVRVHNPLMRKVDSSFGITGDGRTAVIEMAAASGIQLVSPEEMDPWVATTHGTGELIKAAMDHGCRDILLGIGGSATNDCGTGMAMALGAEFFTASGKPAGQGGGALGEIKRIELGGLDHRLGGTRVLVACDVTNPLTGPDGASHVYGPQKGADKALVKKLDRNLSLFAGLIRDQLGKDVENVPGAGAAGGLGAGLIAFLDAKLVEGFPEVAERTGLEKAVQWADLVITGEGAMDHQTRFGKTPCGVARIAKRHNTPVIALSGTLGKGAHALYEAGIDAMFSILDAPMTLAEALDRTALMLENTGENIGRLLKLGIAIACDPQGLE